MPTLISPLSWADQPGVSISTDSEVEGLGVRALLTPVLGEVWRTGSGTAGQRSLSVDLGADRPIRAVVLAAPRDGLLPEPSATIAAQLTGAESASVTGSFTMPLGYWCWVFPAEIQARQLVLTITSAQPYLQFGRLWIGSGAWCGRYLAEGGFDPATTDTVGQAPLRRAQVTLAGLTQSEADALEVIGLDAGTQRQVMAIPRTERADRSAIIGKFTAIPAPKPRQAWSPAGQLHTATLTIQEDR
jgi:hypothetical protein